MKTVTYTDLEDAAPVVEVMGVVFVSGEPKEVDDTVADHLAGNPFFAFDDSQAKAEEAERMGAVKARGVQARMDGKDRSVPPAYRGKPEEDAWLSGYNEAGN